MHVEGSFITFGIILFLGILMHTAAPVVANRRRYNSWDGFLVAGIISTLVFVFAASICLQSSAYWDEGVQRYHDPNYDVFFVWVMTYSAAAISNLAVAVTLKK